MAYYGGGQGICYEFRDSGVCRYGDECRFSHNRDGYGGSNWSFGGRTQQSASKFNDIASFFKTYPKFDYDPTNDAVSEWRRLLEELGHDPDDKDEYEVRDTWRNLRTAMVRQFNARYGKDEEDLAAWQGLCSQVDVPVPDTIPECPQAIKGTHVNLVDLTELSDDNVPVKFPTEVALSEYTLETGKIFPREHAEAGGLLRKLLRHIMNPRPEELIRGTGRRGGKRGRRRH